MTKYEYAYCPPRPDWQEANIDIIPAATADGGDEVFNYEEGTSLRLSVTHGVATLYASASVRWLRSDEFPCDDYVEIVLARRAVRQ